MRWLKARFSGTGNERGASGMLVALIMLVLIGAGAMAVDVGQIYAERGELQNGADAGAIAVAQLCASSSGCTQSSANTAAKQLVDQTSRDGVSRVRSVDLSVQNQVTVKTSTIDGNSNAGFLTKMFASALSSEPATVGATATAALVAPNGGGGFPLAFSNKCWDLAGGVASGNLQKVSWKPGITCTNPSGHTIPGGWGWLDDADKDCKVVTTVGNIAGSDPGNNKPSQCASVLQGWINTLSSGQVLEVPFPVFDTATGTGNTGSFHLMGYATFRITGWKFGQGGVYEFRNTTAAVGNSNLSCSAGPDRCIIGKFIKFVSLDDIEGGGTGTGANLGTVVVKLIK